MEKPSKREDLHNKLINSWLSTCLKNRFFSYDELFARKEAILSGGCAENILTFCPHRRTTLCSLLIRPKASQRSQPLTCIVSAAQ